MSLTSYTFFSDPGHAWLRVTHEECRLLGILDKISSCSYQKDEYLYLEEDCDAALFIEAKRKKGDGKIHILEFVTNRESAIRNYRRFSQ